MPGHLLHLGASPGTGLQDNAFPVTYFPTFPKAQMACATFVLEETATVKKASSPADQGPKLCIPFCLKPLILGVNFLEDTP